ncbi:MAG: MoaD/ThiS family protein [Deltaproteobacteria bacterium]|nr:MoaD/ThiS family protein [Deltaproteobacteria bacterium]
MVVSVKFFGLQRRLTRKERIKVPVPEKTRVTDVLCYLEQQYPDMPLGEDTVTVTVNNQISNRDQILEENDHIAFIPHVGGG